MDLSIDRIRISSQREKTAVVSPWGFEMEATYEYQEGDSPTYSPLTGWEPGSPPIVEVLTCTVNGADITEMLRPEQYEQIGDAILELIDR